MTVFMLLLLLVVVVLLLLSFATRNVSYKWLSTYRSTYVGSDVCLACVFLSLARNLVNKHTHFIFNMIFKTNLPELMRLTTHSTVCGQKASNEREREREFLIFNWLKFSKVNKWFFIICRNEVVKFHSPLPQRRNYLHIMEASDFNCIKQTSTMPLWVWWRFSSLEFFSAPRSALIITISNAFFCDLFDYCFIVVGFFSSLSAVGNCPNWNINQQIDDMNGWIFYYRLWYRKKSAICDRTR